MMFVDRCVCHKVPFKLLDQIVENEHNIETEPAEFILDALAARTKCSTGCGMCRPYILRMIKTGQTSFIPFPPNQH